MNREISQIVETTARELFGKIGLEGELRFEQKDEESILVDVTTGDPQLYIGEKGQTMAEILYVLKAMLRKKLGEPVYVILDINDYRKSKERYVRELARTTADEVSLLKVAKELPPMSAAERRVAHMELQERSDIETESVGEGEERRVVVKLRTKAPEEASNPG
jgi:spoIIIJ-associated protein